MYDEEQVAVRVEVLRVEHSGGDACESADVREAISCCEDCIVVPKSEKAEKIERSGEESVSREVRVRWVFMRWLIASRYDK